MPAFNNYSFNAFCCKYDKNIFSCLSGIDDCFNKEIAMYADVIIIL